MADPAEVIVLEQPPRVRSSSPWSTLGMAFAGLAVVGGLAYLAVSSGVDLSALATVPSVGSCPHCGGDRDAAHEWCAWCGRRYVEPFLERVPSTAASSEK